MVETMLQHFNVAKLLPVWTLFGKESYAMIANHAIPVIVDASLKGIKGFDKEQAFAAIKATLTTNKNPKYNWDLYMKCGYLPSDSVKREAVSRTLEAAYDDWCAARLAKLLNKTADYNYFSKRSSFYKNLFDKSTNLMRGKLADGNWVQPFAKLDSGQLAIGGDYTEGNAWQYTWQVQHDIPGLINLMGGKKAFLIKLDSLFSMDSKVFGKGSTLDVTGLIGQYAHGNEPNHHIAYLYTLAGDAAKTQRLVRQTNPMVYPGMMIAGKCRHGISLQPWAFTRLTPPTVNMCLEHPS
jgi:predicted alpha-1,2-mannosidase